MKTKINYFSKELFDRESNDKSISEEVKRYSVIGDYFKEHSGRIEGNLKQIDTIYSRLCDLETSKTKGSLSKKLKEDFGEFLKVQHLIDLKSKNF